MKKTLPIAALLVWVAFAQNGQAQQLALFSEYLHNSFTINPAMMGWENIHAVSATYRHQWTGMTNAPRTATLTYQNFNEKYNMGYGGYFMHDQTGPTSFTGFNAAYSYQIPMDSEKKRLDQRNRLCLGLSLSGQIYRLRGLDLRYNDPDDQLIINANESKFLPDVGVGAFYYNDLYFVGVSVPQLISMRVRFTDATSISNLRRVAHFYTTAGAKIRLTTKDKKKHHIIPSFWIKYVPTSPLNVNLNVRYNYENLFMTGLGFATDGSMILDASVHVKKNFRIGYAFSVGLNGLAQYLGTNHELMFTYVFSGSGKGWVFPKIDAPVREPKPAKPESNPSQPVPPASF